jgi:nicotinate-nucleotide pyrophosphorylase (carboxylating)
MEDLQDRIFRSVATKKVTACIFTDDAGIVAGTDSVKEEAVRLELFIERIVEDGDQVRKGDEIVRFKGSPKQVVVAEDLLIGLLAKPSGIATATRKAIELTKGKPIIVCGGWKKMPYILKDMIRRALVKGGAQPRICPQQFIYLDKNYVKLLGGIKESLKAVSELKDYTKVIQIRGSYDDIGLEACEAARYGAKVLFIDTGKANDVNLVNNKLVQMGLRNKVKIAFGGGIRLKDIDTLKAMDIDILDIGRALIDAPLLDMRLEIIDANGDRMNK